MVCAGAPTFKSLINIGLEDVAWGTASTNMHLLPATEIDAEDKYESIRDQAYRGIAARDFLAAQGVGHSEINVGTNLYPNELGYVLYLLMGAVNTSGAGPYVHELTLDPCPLSLTVEEGGLNNGGLDGRRYTGCRVGSVQLKFNGAQGYVMAQIGLQGRLGAEDTINGVADATTIALTGWQGQVKLAGADDSTILSGDITFTRDYTVRNGIRDDQNPSALYAGPLGVDWNLTCDAQDNTNWLQMFRQYVKEGLELNFVYKTPVFPRVAGADLTTPEFGLDVMMTKAVFGDGLKVDRSSPGNLAFAVTGHGEYNSTDAGPAKLTLTNTQSSYAT